ncbi:hypothetical protein [Lapidilactobacillus wuchangensis]|uniref:hypothetical protein n=1 Tax=Lapidilactobacillus wuchangensis TaxID=2486001 RepID=UPI000F77DB9E|nr:hypothetical protein [Lapidilactobacillus wuchangensis]
MKIDFWHHGNWRFTTILLGGSAIVLLNRIFSGAQSAYSAGIPIVLGLAIAHYQQVHTLAAHKTIEEKLHE